MKEKKENEMTFWQLKFYEFQNKMQDVQLFTCRTFPFLLVSHLEGGIQHVPLSGGNGGKCRYL